MAKRHEAFNSVLKYLHEVEVVGLLEAENRKKKYQQAKAAIQTACGANLHIRDCIDCVIPDFLFLGDAYEAASKTLLQKHKIDVVMNCTKRLRFFWPQDFEYRRLPVNDSFEDAHLLWDMFDASTAFLRLKRKQKKRVFVHCAQGISRSVSFIIAYLISEHKMSFDDALARVRKKRSIARPNACFALKLRKWDAKKNGSKATIKDAIKQCLEVLESKAAGESILVLKEAINSNPGAEEEFVKVISKSFDLDSRQRILTMKLVKECKKELNIRFLVNHLLRMLNNIHVDVPKVGHYVGECYLAPLVRADMLKRDEITAMFKKSPVHPQLVDDITQWL